MEGEENEVASGDISNVEAGGGEKVIVAVPSQPELTQDAPADQRKQSKSVTKTTSAHRQKQVSMIDIKNKESSTSAARTKLYAASMESTKSRPLSVSVDPRDRRQSSTFRKAKVGSVIAVTKGSMAELGDKQAPKYMNTYKLYSDHPFNVDEVSKILQAVMDELVDDELEYDSTETPLKAKKACGLIQTRIKELHFDRYKLVCIVTLGEKKSQDVYSTVRFLWDIERDKFATYSQENMRMFGVASVFGLYYE